MNGPVRALFKGFVWCSAWRQKWAISAACSKPPEKNCHRLLGKKVMISCCHLLIACYERWIRRQKEPAKNAAFSLEICQRRLTEYLLRYVFHEKEQKLKLVRARQVSTTSKSYSRQWTIQCDIWRCFLVLTGKFSGCLLVSQICLHKFVKRLFWISEYWFRSEEKDR